MGVQIKKLSWDSGFFGYPIGKVLLGVSNEDILTEIKNASKPFRLVYVFSDEKIEHHGFKHVDSKIVFKKENLEISETSSKSYNITSFESDIHDVAQLKELAFQSGKYSRFYVDKDFKNNEYFKLYSEWLSKSIDRTIALKTLVALEGKKNYWFYYRCRS